MMIHDFPWRIDIFPSEENVGVDVKCTYFICSHLHLLRQSCSGHYWDFPWMLSPLSDLLGPDLSVSNVQYCNNNALQYQYRYQYQFSTLTVFIGAKTPNQPSNHCRVLLCQCLYIHLIPSNPCFDLLCACLFLNDFCCFLEIFTVTIPLFYSHGTCCYPLVTSCVYRHGGFGALDYIVKSWKCMNVLTNGELKVFISISHLKYD